MAAILRILDRLSQFMAEVAALMVGAIAVFILSEIVCRSAFNMSLSFAWEYSAYCMAMSIFCGAAYTLHSAGHVRVNLLSTNVPAAVGWGLEILATVLGIVIAGYIAWALTGLAIDSVTHDSRSATPMEVRLVFPQGAMAAGAIMLTVQMLVRLLRVLLRLPTEIAPASDYSVE